MYSFRVLVCLIGCYTGANAYLQWPTKYYYKAVLNIPSANLVQPYEVWANGNSGNLRFDFFDGMTKIYKKRKGNDPDLPFRYFWVGPGSTSNNLNNTICRLLNIKSREVKLINNTYLQPTMYRLYKTGQDINQTTKWEYQFKGIYETIYHYIVWTTESAAGHIPVRYEYRMLHKGIELDFRQQIYVNFTIVKPDPAVFKMPPDLKCKASSDNDIDENLLMHYDNPVLEYNVTEEFEKFKATYNKQYKNENEHFTRFQVFQKNLGYIQSMNRRQNSFKLAVNHLADLTEEELSALLGTKVDPEIVDSNEFEDDYEDNGQFDWRWYNASSPVKDQTGLCGSCYAFATAAAVESSVYISKGCYDMEEASEQALIDCSRGHDRSGNDGCNGGFLYDTLKWIKGHGIPLRKDYGPYLAMEGYCNMDQPRFLRINRYEKLPVNVKAIKKALRHHGPLVTTMNVPQSLFYYASGIYNDKSCSSDPKKMNHAILIVGYGKEGDKRYWIVKNSYGSNWGDGGYFKLDMEENLCGITNTAYAVIRENSLVNNCRHNQ